MDHIHILGMELELACNGGSFGEISLKIFARENIALHEPRLKASSSSIPRIRNRPIFWVFHQKGCNSHYYSFLSISINPVEIAELPIQWLKFSFR